MKYFTNPEMQAVNPNVIYFSKSFNNQIAEQNMHALF